MVLTPISPLYAHQALWAWRTLSSSLLMTVSRFLFLSRTVESIVEFCPVTLKWTVLSWPSEVFHVWIYVPSRTLFRKWQLYEQRFCLIEVRERVRDRGREGTLSKCYRTSQIVLYRTIDISVHYGNIGFRRLERENNDESGKTISTVTLSTDIILMPIPKHEVIWPALYRCLVELRTS